MPSMIACHITATVTILGQRIAVAAKGGIPKTDCAIPGTGMKQRPMADSEPAMILCTAQDKRRVD